MEIVIKNLIKKYNQKTILNIPSMYLMKGTIIGLLGDNGSGKSTLLNMISGMDKDYEGEILYGGYPFNKQYRQTIGMVSQKPYLFQRSVYENIEYPLKIKKVEKNKREEIVEQFLRVMHLEGVKNQRADTLSGGEAQKVALARVLAKEPNLLLLDETTSNIHEDAVQSIENQLKLYHKKTNCTIIFVTHNQSQAERFCHQSICLEDYSKI